MFTRPLAHLFVFVCLTPALAEAEGGVVYLATDRGIFRSADSGQTWTTVYDSPPAERPTVVAVHPGMRDVVYAGGTNGLVRSQDGGHSWNPVFAITGSVRAVVFSYVNPSSIYVVADQFWRSQDGGESWDVFARDLPDAPVSIAIDYANEDRLFLLTRAGLFRSEDGGTTFVSLLSHVYPPAGLSVTTGALGTGHVYLAFAGGIAFSPDSGNTWKLPNWRSPTGSGDINGSPMFEIVFRSASAIAADLHNATRLVACGITALVAWDGYELVSGPGIYESGTGWSHVNGMYEYGFRTPGPEPYCLFTAIDSSQDGAAWIGTARGLLYSPGGSQPAWREVPEFRDIAVFAATFTN